MSEAIRYKDVLVQPKSELHGILTSNDPQKDKKAAELYKKVTEDGYNRGEFIRPVKQPKETPLFQPGLAEKVTEDAKGAMGSLMNHLALGGMDPYQAMVRSGLTSEKK